MRLTDIGYNSTFEANRAQPRFADYGVARVISEAKGEYRVLNENGEFRAKVTGKQMFEANSREDFPAVGDWVAVTELNTEQAVINGILPRVSILKRIFGDKNKEGAKSEVQVIAANVDAAFVVESVDRDFSLNRFERYSTLAKTGNMKPVFVLNKADLLSKEALNERLAAIKHRFEDTDVLFTSTTSELGLSELEKYMRPGTTYCFLGSSGVGKSSIINKLLGKDAIRTGEISFVSGRGKHTTTSRQMYFLASGAIVIDNPGIREVGLASPDNEVDEIFEEIAEKSQGCKFADCTHTHEPGCKVQEAIENEELDAESYANYLNLKKEAEYLEMSEFEKRDKDRAFGKFVKKVKKDLKNTNKRSTK